MPTKFFEMNIMPVFLAVLGIIFMWLPRPLNNVFEKLFSTAFMRSFVITLLTIGSGFWTLRWWPDKNMRAIFFLVTTSVVSISFLAKKLLRKPF